MIPFIFIPVNGSLQAGLQALDNICKSRVEEMDSRTNGTVRKLEQKNNKRELNNLYGYITP